MFVCLEGRTYKGYSPLALLLTKSNGAISVSTAVSPTEHFLLLETISLEFHIHLVFLLPVWSLLLSLLSWLLLLFFFFFNLSSLPWISSSIMISSITCVPALPKYASPAQTSLLSSSHIKMPIDSLHLDVAQAFQISLLKVKLCILSLNLIFLQVSLP